MDAPQTLAGDVAGFRSSYSRLIDPATPTWHEPSAAVYLKLGTAPPCIGPSSKRQYGEGSHLRSFGHMHGDPLGCGRRVRLQLGPRWVPAAEPSSLLSATVSGIFCSTPGSFPSTAPLCTHPLAHTQTHIHTYTYTSTMVDTCTCQNSCGACGPSGTGCACAKGKCNCQNCVNKASSCDQCAGANECKCAKEGKACSCGK
ncbi:hypothetical protein ONZ51_g7327 [Trametes cubensis]|uniref:Metallothionein n=1 Tax=Trametes cubensis TaxID=1111947 RepID=A0AAD7TQT5_9APHY|nr:hypothetical protein ONZ51_g7327 [Trametes cubensis]